ncbi:ribonuclease H-like domain-containing protein [Tanacetum coccineum]
MTGSDATIIPTPLSEKLSFVTHHHLLTQVMFKLDLDNWNFGSWEFFFEELCASYEFDKYLRSPINETSASSLATLTPEETKVDKTDNKRSRTNTLMAELRSIKLGDQSMESYFQKIDSIVNILSSLNARVNEEYVVNYALKGLADTYNQVCGYMHWKDTFPDLKAVRSLLIAEEIRLMSKVLTLPVDSSPLRVLVVESSTNSHSSMSQGKSWKPCFNFSKGSCRFGNSCRYVHDANARVSNANSGFNKGRGTSENTTNDLLTKLLAQLSHLGMNVVMSNNGTNVTLPTHAIVTPTITGPNISSNVPTTPHAFTLAQVHLLAQTLHLHLGFPAVPRPCLVLSSGAVNTSGQATLLPQAFTARTLHDPTTGAWNIDTGTSSHLNNYVTSLSTILNSCLYSTILVGDGHSIPITNTGHIILSTPLKSLRLNNVLITPHIIKNLIFVPQFVHDNDCTIEFDLFGFSVKDCMTRRVLLRCDSTGDLYPVMAPSSIPSAFLVNQQT